MYFSIMYSTVQCSSFGKASVKASVVQACDRLDDEVHEIRRKNMRQLTIPQSFGLSYSR